ncbi:MAG: DNA-directed RNA polymerase subunit beta', partial [Patescibacteria group bacterium]
LRRTLASRIWGRCAASDILHPKSGKVLAPARGIINKETAKVIEEAGVEEVNIRSVIACKSLEGVCQTCYGYDLGVNKMIEIGQPIGIVAAQAIGEPGTQLTMRTFHTGGVAGGEDITGGLPRVVEIFEARIPRGQAVISEIDGIVEDIIERNGKMAVRIKSSEKKETKKKGRKNKNKEEGIYEYEIGGRAGIWVKKGELVVKGTQLSEGHLDLHNLFENAGADAVQRYIFAEVQKIYSLQGAAMNDKHIEVIIRQMFSRLAVKDAGDTLFVPGEIIEKTAFNRENRRVKEKGSAPATAVQLLLGITRVALTTESFLSAASFQETTKVLISAAIEGKEDKLRGLKENVIIGRLIPTGTGYRKKEVKK